MRKKTLVQASSSLSNDELDFFDMHGMGGGRKLSAPSRSPRQTTPLSDLHSERFGAVGGVENAG